MSEPPRGKKPFQDAAPLPETLEATGRDLKLAKRPTSTAPRKGQARPGYGRNAVTYWRKGMPSQNFGDYLSEILYDALCGRTRARGRSHEFGQLFLIGSVISDWHIRKALPQTMTMGRRRSASGAAVCAARPRSPPTSWLGVDSWVCAAL